MKGGTLVKLRYALATLCVVGSLGVGTALAQESPEPPERALLDSAAKLIESDRPTELELKEGLRQLNAALEINPDASRVHYELGRYHAIAGYGSDGKYREGALDKAIASVREATRLDPGFGGGWVYLGYLLGQAGQFDEARLALAKARELGAQDDWLEVNEAEIDVLTGALPAAQARLEAYLAREHDTPRAVREAHRLYVRSYVDAADRGNADRAYGARAKAYPADAHVRSSYALQLATRFGDFDAAIEHAREALALNANTEGRRALGLALYAKWAEQRETDPAAARGLLREAETYLPMFFVTADPAMDEPKLAGLKKAVAEAGVVDEEGKPRFLRYLLWRLLEPMGLAGVGWPAWLALGGLLVAFGIVLDRAQARRRAARPAMDVPAGGTPLALRFTGSGSEYFRIWIVNLLLTILTLGIYSAWAKVRKLKYFYRNTELADARFDYHGDPVAILKGRFVAVALLLAYNYAFTWSATLGFATLGALALLLPWLLRSSLRFRLRYSSYRGVRFGFTGSTGGAYYVFLIGFIASVVTLYLLAPFFHQRLKRYQHDNARYGQLQSTFDATPGAYYKLYARFAGIFLGAVFLAGIVAALVAPALGGGRMAPLVIGAIGILYVAAFLMAAPYLNSRLQNLLWNSTRLGPHRFENRLKARRLCWIYVSNFVLILLTLGFYMPWASVRLARYKMESLSFIAAGSVEDVFAQSGTREAATGEEAAEFFDIDISL